MTLTEVFAEPGVLPGVICLPLAIASAEHPDGARVEGTVSLRVAADSLELAGVPARLPGQTLRRSPRLATPPSDTTLIAPAEAHRRPEVSPDQPAGQRDVAGEITDSFQLIKDATGIDAFRNLESDPEGGMRLSVDPSDVRRVHGQMPVR